MKTSLVAFGLCLTMLIGCDKSSSSPHDDMMQFRMAQYGFKERLLNRREYQEETAKVMALEALLKNVVIVSNTQAAQLSSAVSTEEAAAIFGLNAKNSAEELQLWLTWFNQRFRPIYLAHMTALYRKTCDIDIAREDEVLDTGNMLDALKSSHAIGNSGPYKVMASPFLQSSLGTLTHGLLGRSGVLDVNADDIQATYDDAQNMIERGGEERDARFAGQAVPACP